MQHHTPSGHRWRFDRLGGFDQVRLDREEDIRHLADLDQKLWAALSCPVNGLELDSRTMTILDCDGDGRVRVQEVLAAVSWSCRMLATLDSFMAGATALPLAAIDTTHEEGQHLYGSARRLLAMLGKSDADAISIEDVAETDSLLLTARYNGDGILPPETTEDEALAQVIRDIIATVGGEPDRSGKEGIGQERLDLFFTDAAAYTAWWDAGQADPDILPFGDATFAAAALFLRLRTKIDDYFLRTGLAAFDPNAAAPMNPALATYETLASGNLTSATGALEEFPLARIEAARPLPLGDGLNPVWAADMAQFTTLVLERLFGTISELDSEQWRKVVETFSAHLAWQNDKQGGEMDSLGIERVQEILAGDTRQRIAQLIAEDLAPAEEIAGIDKVVGLVYFNRDLHRLLRNFVSFTDFYGRRDKAIFQAGTLYIDGRALELCIKVKDINSHSAMATLSRTYLAYCSCQRRNSAETMTIAAAFTGGDADNLMVGRNGVFYDRAGNDWDATIVRIIEHPISVRQAFWSPYKRIARMIGEQIEKFATARDKAVDARAGAGMTDMSAKAAAGEAKTAQAAPFDVAKFAGIFAAIGLALGAIGTALATLFGVFFALPLWQMPLVIAGMLLAVSGPSMLIAYLKLRQRNIGPMLDANGWAVNTRAGINIPFGTTLTRLAELPKGAERSLADPYAEKKTPWKLWIIVLVLLTALAFSWQNGYLQQGLARLTATVAEKSGEPAPAPTPPAATK